MTLRPWRDDDVPLLAALVRDTEVVRWTDVPPDYSEADGRDWLAHVESEHTRGRGVYLAVEEGGVLAGACDIRVLASDPAVGELGFWLGPAARGRGVMTRAVRLISRWAFEELGLARVQLLAHPDNHASIQVAERAGFVREGILRSYREKGGRREDRLIFSLLP